MERLFILSYFLIVLVSTSWAQELQPNPNIKNLVIVFKTHFDIGYTDYAESVVSKYSGSLIRNALEIQDAGRDLPENEQFVWTMAGWPMKAILENSQPDIQEKVGVALQEGRFAIHALPFTLETEACDLENLARSFSFSTDISRHFGLELSRDAKMTDVPSHSWILPTLLTNAGVDILHLGCNPASQSPDVPMLFWWEGPDGSRLMTMYWSKYYGTDLVPPEDWPYKSWLAIIHTNDNQGPPKPEELKKIMKEANYLAPNATIHIGRISDFHDLLMKEKPDLPVVRGDMPDTWIHGYMSMPREVKNSRRMKKDMFSLEALNTNMNFWAEQQNDISNLISEANENALLFDEHTFGLAMSHGHSGYFSYGDEFRSLKAQDIFEPIEHSWNEKADRVFQMEKKVIPMYTLKLDELASMVKVDGNRIIVYNPLPWERNGVVMLQTLSSHLEGNVLEDLSTGKYKPFSNKGNIIRFKAENVPAMGYKTYVPIAKKVRAEGSLFIDRNNNILENEYFRIIIDPDQGSIKSITNKKSGQEMRNQESEYGFGGYMYERFSKKIVESYTTDYVKGGWEWALDELGKPNLSNDPYYQIKKQKMRITYQEDQFKASAILHSESEDETAHDYSLVVSLYDKQPYIELTWAIHSKPAEPWPEAGWITFPLNIKDPTFKLGRLGGIVDPERDFVKGSNFDYYFLNTGMAVIDESGSGFGLFSPDVPGISLDRPGLWKYSGDFMPEQANVFFNLYNNQWSTNFTEWIEGSWSARFYLWSIDSYDNESAIITPSEEFRQPLKAGYAGYGPDFLPPSHRGIRINAKGILVTAFGIGSDDELFLRLWEQAGEAGECEVQLPDKMEASIAVPVDLRGQQVGEPIFIKNGTFILKYKPYKPYTFLLK
ncbi:glycoside hydrolase family 38 C-terminal domain-containing protein [Bacteroidota bacterium]